MPAFFLLSFPSVSLSGQAVQRVGTVSLHEAIVFHDERARRILIPRGIVFFHQIVAQFCAVPELHQTVRLLKGHLFDKVEASVLCRQQHAHMPDEERVVGIGELIVQDDGDQPCSAV